MGSRAQLANLVVDGANGVGAEKLELLMKMVVPDGFGEDDAGIRGAIISAMKSRTLCASLDGDADRLVYFMIPSSSGKDIILVDGDKILSLFALFIEDHLSVWPGFTPTGVKYLHEKGAKYDIGIYFEANGHGTILFLICFLSWLEARSNELTSNSACSDQQRAALWLMAVSKLIYQSVGDALSGLLLVEAMLFHVGWSISQWNELYHDLPNGQLKFKATDRRAVVTTNSRETPWHPRGHKCGISKVSTRLILHSTIWYRRCHQGICREASTQNYADGFGQVRGRACGELTGIVSLTPKELTGFLLLESGFRRSD
ncbi:hypothetical protein MLD38_010650 [Melastoma candidum]|uniref:Uncharacterized protein n=1 Tax=Melastoma candidum TaxID=119954 RepID=A0ACB9R1L2_9MYRT|nr:hypothetical protein MLD38_010650 [Melastoma candidum]